MLRKFLKIALGLLAAFVLLQIIIYAMVYLNAKTGDPVKSPNGKYEAYIVERGFLDSTDNRLRIKKMKAPARDVCEVWGTDIKWSPDSRLVAVVDKEDDLSYDIQIYDIVSDLFGRCYCTIDLKQKNNSGYDSMPHIVWDWDDSDTVIFATEDPQTEKRKTIATINIKNTCKKLRVYVNSP